MLSSDRVNRIAAAAVNALQPEPKWHRNEANTNILIAGAARVGKSKLATRLARECGYSVVSTDVVRLHFWELEDGDFRVQVQHAVYRRLLEKFPCNLIVEGNNLIGDTPRQGQPTTDLTLVAALHHDGLAKAFILGCADDAWDQKLEAIETYAHGNLCWTPRLTHEEKVDFVQSVVRRSEKLKEQARDHGLPYIEVGTNDFDAALDRAMKLIERECCSQELAPELVRRLNLRAYDAEQKRREAERALIASKRTIEEIEASASWRITAPMRSVGRSARKILAKLGRAPTS